MSVLGTAQLFALAGLMFALVGFAVASALAQLSRERLATLEPDSRARAWTAIGSLPLVTTLAGLVACVLPSALAHLLGAHDHCTHHAGHPHLCPWHVADDAGSLAGWVVVAIASGALAVAAFRAVVGLRRARRITDALGSDVTHGHRVVDSATPFSAAVGLFEPVVVVSRGLVEALRPLELEAALAHERAHARRRDALRLWTLRSLWSLVPTALSRTWIAELALACEEACDRVGAEAVGDPLIVADAIVKTSRAMRPLDLGIAMGLGPTAVERRVRALLDPPSERSHAGGISLIAFSVALLLLAEPLHHATETLLGFLAH